MKRILKNVFIFILLFVILILAVSSKVVKAKFPKGVFVAQGEDYIKKMEVGGKVTTTGDRVDASNGKNILAWNDKGHNLSWSIMVLKKGKYNVAIRYCQNRGGNSYRKLIIDGGKISNKAFDRIALVPTGGWSKSENNWNNIFVTDESGKPVEVEIPFGKHLFTFENLGGDGQDGASNFDLIAVMSPNTNLAVLGKADFKPKQ